MDFDRCNGELNYKIKGQMPDLLPHTAGWVEFSPNGQYLYLGSETFTYQYDIENEDFENSKILIAKYNPDLPSQHWNGGFERPWMATNGRIYYWAGNGLPYYSQIKYPNQKGPDVGWTQDYAKTPINLPWRVQKFVDYSMKALPEPCPILNNPQYDTPSFAVYPNPVTNTLVITGHKDSEFAYILDAMGTQVWIGVTNELINGKDFSYLKPGVYVLKVGKLSKRFLKI